jgi:LuxR family transcriptional regulator, maltose regulon positive regulatory protein
MYSRRVDLRRCRTCEGSVPTPADWFVANKFRPPLPQPGAIGRGLVAVLLDALPRHRLTLLSAPAGYGKTTLLAAAARDGAVPVAWYSLDAEDDDPARWLLGLLAAIRRLAPELGERLLFPADGTELNNTSPAGRTSPFLAALLNDVERRIPDPFVLVLDDLHVVSDPAIHAALNFLIDRMPPQMHLTVSTRYDPPLRIPRLRARRELFELRAPDLRFEPDEAAEFLDRTLMVSLPRESLELVRTQAQGWPAGLVLLAGALGRIGTAADRSAFVSETLRTRRPVFEFLADEVLGRQEPEVRQFLLETSILDELTPPACEAVTGLAGAGAMLELLVRRNLFLATSATTSGEEPVYRYHDLFTEFLRSRLRQEAPQRVAELHARAAGAVRLPARAIHHWLEAGRPDEAATEIERVGDELILQGLLTTVLVWLGSLPDAAYQRHPRLIYMRGICALQKGDLDGLEETLERALAECRRAGDATGEGDVHCAMAAGAFNRADFERCAALVEQAEALPLRAAPRVLVRMLRASLALFVTGEFAKASRQLDAALAEVTSGHSTESLLYFALVLGPEFTILPGALESIERFCADVGARPEAVTGPIRLAIDDVRAAILLRRGHLDAAVQTGMAALAMKGALGGYLFLGLNAALMVATVHAARGDHATAHRYLRIMRDQVGQMALNRVIQADGLYPYGRLCWLEGRVDETRLALARMGDPASGPGSGPALGASAVFRLLLRAMLEITDREYERAERTLRAAIALERDEPIAGVYASPALLLAHLQWVRQRPRAALALLREVMEACAASNTPGVILQEGSLVIPILRYAVVQDVHATYARHLLEELEGPAQRRPATPRGAGPISPREIEVVRLIAEGASNVAIAERLGVSVPTIKSHIAHVMDKVDASSRTQVVARARQLGILTDD